MSGARRATLIPALALSLLAAAVAPASAARPVEPADLTRAHALAPVVDRVLPPGPMGARAAGGRTETFTDPKGYRITISTDIPDLDLSRYASVLAGTIHGKEINYLRVEVVPSASIGSACGAEEALGCYKPENPARSPRGQMTVPAERPDLTHVLVHEYGHHVDNQLVNLGHIERSCNFSNDGSRNWFFAREVANKILERGFGCAPQGGYTFLLGELYAEDYTATNGVQDWVLPSTTPPTDAEKAALRGDIARPFVPHRRRLARAIRAGGSYQRRIRVRDWTVLTLASYGAGRTNVDFSVYRAGRSRPLDRSTRGRALEGAIPPGSYRIVVRPHSGSARAHVRIDLF